jgi:hypothetical protein
MKKIENSAAFIFILAIAVLSFISILGVWDFFSHDVISKSFQTLGLLAAIAVIVLVAGKFMDKSDTTTAVESVPNPTFKAIRKITLTVLIVSASILAILGVLAIWDVITDKDVLYKSLSSVGILAFGSFIITMVSLDREGSSFMNRGGRKMSVGGIIIILFAAYMILPMFFSMLFRW